MHKKASGFGREKEHVHEQMKSAKQEFLEAMQHLRNKKDEHKEIKQQNEEERKKIKEEERKANSFKFSKMEKKIPFLPSIKQREGFEEFKTNNVGEKFMDSRQKYQLLFPQKCFEKKLKFNYTKHAAGFFQKPVGQENDTYDEVLKKAMASYDRGQTIMQEKTKTEDGKWMKTTTVRKTDSIIKPNTFSLNLFDQTKPLLDNSNTPRGAKKAITLERNFDHDIWVYNKGSLDEFSQAAKDAKRGKILKRKIMRRQRELTNRASPMGTRSNSRGRSMSK